MRLYLPPSPRRYEARGASPIADINVTLRESVVVSVDRQDRSSRRSRRGKLRAQIQIGERLKYRKYFGFVLPKWHFGRGLAL
jgi:hypothetical protein